MKTVAIALLVLGILFFMSRGMATSSEDSCPCAKGNPGPCQCSK